MTYAIEWSPAAVKTLATLPRDLRARIVDRVEALAADPHAANANVKKLVGDPAFRLRVGDWRVIYELQDRRLVIEVLRVAPRGSAYD